jgi:hypothetical protein
VDSRTGAVRFGQPGEKGLVTKWRIERGREGPCTFRVAKGKFQGWFLSVSDKAEKRIDAEGRAVQAFPLVLVPAGNARCVFEAVGISR